MAAAQAAQQKRPQGLTPVHQEPGAVQFQYSKAYGALGGGLDLGNSAAAPQPLLTADRPQSAEPARLPPALEEVEDFISLEGYFQVHDRIEGGRLL